ncbi:putative nucleotidyltransferase, Ribonuclease H [Helianthus annuus]|nr:putative nucleotidyltransferase, Ribonuclease H [Helianthus annuus]KAJ0632755.1 putative nucleotidyltransferase, Ribonuclease H [Helianthus annuus]
MEAIRKQATKLREQVARQQQIVAVFKQFGGGGYGGSDNVVTDEAELKLHQKLEKLYISTRAAKHFQRDIVRGVEGYIVTGSKQVEIGTKLSEDSRKYGVENTCTSGSTLSRAAKNFSRARAQMEKERGNLLKSFGTQVAEPLRAMVMGAPLEDARHLAQRYDRMRQEAEAQAVEVSKRQARVREGAGNPDMIMKLEAAESKLQDLKSNMAILGREAASAMAAVEAQQQKMTLQRLISMIESERAYHQKVLEILDHLEGEMVSERQRIEAAPPPTAPVETPPPPSYEEVNNAFTSPMPNGSNDEVDYFLGEAMYTFRAESDSELGLSTGDYVVVRKVSNNGWAEGECKGKAGWFPLGYIERRERVLASKLKARSIDELEVQDVVTEEDPNWMTPIKKFLQNNELPNDQIEAERVKIKARQYVLQGEILYKKGYLAPLLRCVGPEQSKYLVKEVHEGICGAHLGARSVVAKLMNLGYFWPSMHRDTVEQLKKCDACQIHSPIPKSPKHDLVPITSAWPFHKWGMDIVGPFPPSKGGVKFLLVAIDYFSKWPEVKPLAKITGKQIIDFVWENIICRYGLPGVIVTDNGKQFAEKPFSLWCKEYRINQIFSSVAYPQSNGQVERTNRSIVEGIKTRLGRYESNWLEELPSVLWAIRTTEKASHRKTPYSLVFGSEAVIPAEIGVVTQRIVNMDPERRPGIKQQYKKPNTSKGWKATTTRRSRTNDSSQGI